jgi:ATP-dependent helicase/nuclease subunit B
LSQTLAGRFLLLLAEVAGEQATPVPLIALLGHPLVKAGRRVRAGWKACARSICCCVDRAPMPGLNPSRA